MLVPKTKKSILDLQTKHKAYIFFKCLLIKVTAPHN